jgi:XTP/dITP diphosphohydrolase
VKKKRRAAIEELLAVMARLRSPKGGCPWDLEQDHMTLRYHAVEEVYELLDAIEAGDDHEMVEELGDLLLQVIFHCQMAKERKAFDFETVCRRIVDKLVRRHPHVFGTANVKHVEGVLTQWEQIKRAEKTGTKHERPSVLDGIPKHLPALLKAEKLVKKAHKGGLIDRPATTTAKKHELGGLLFDLAQAAQARGWSAEELLRAEVARQEKILRRKERKTSTLSK